MSAVLLIWEPNAEEDILLSEALVDRVVGPFPDRSAAVDYAIENVDAAEAGQEWAALELVEP